MLQASYVASTKYKVKDKNNQLPVVWKKNSIQSKTQSDNTEKVSIRNNIDENIEREDYMYIDKPLFLGINQEIKVIKEFINHYI